MSPCDPSPDLSTLEPKVADPSTRNFERWMQNTGFDLNGIEIRHDPESGRGGYATRDLPTDHVLFRIPKSAIIGATSSAFYRHIEKEPSLSGWKALIAALTYEYANIGESRWREYLKALPETLPTPLFWTEEELGMLKGTGIVERLNLGEIDHVFKNTMMPFYRKHANKISEKFMTKDMFVRMGSIVMGYSFTVENETIMVPMADFLNYRTGHTNAHLVQVDNDDIGDGGTLFEMVTIRPIRAGAQVYNTYGDRPNAELFRRYGYIDNPNRYNMTCFTTKELFAQISSDVEWSRLSGGLKMLRRIGEVRSIADVQCTPFCKDDDVILVVRTGRVSKATVQYVGNQILIKATSARLKGLSEARKVLSRRTSSPADLARVLNREETSIMDALHSRLQSRKVERCEGCECGR